MAIPTYNAAPLSKTFLLSRLLQLLSFAAIISITASFVSTIIAANAIPPLEFIATLTVTSLAAFYVLLTLPFFWAQATRGLLVMCLLDFLLAAAFVVVAVTLGRPVSYLNCFEIKSAAGSGSKVGFAGEVAGDMGKSRDLVVWVGATRAACFETKAVWGLSVALGILFLCSSLVLPALFARQKRAVRTAAKVGA